MPEVQKWFDIPENQELTNRTIWSRNRPIARIIRRTFGLKPVLRGARYLIWGEIRAFIHRLTYLFRNNLHSMGAVGSSPGYFFEIKSNAKATALGELINQRPWLTPYDQDVFYKGWEAASVWMKQQSLPGTCRHCFFWDVRNGALNGYGVCMYSERTEQFGIGPTIKSGLITIQTFGCTNFSERCKGDK